MSAITIRDVRVILTSPRKHDRHVVVKVETSEPGLYGVGCATFTQRFTAVKTAVEDYLRPFSIGKDVHRIEDFWRSAWVSSYWRNGPVLNNAISGVDMALWDIKGKLANMPVYQLLGGKCRDGVAVYGHAEGKTLEQVVERGRAYMERGYQYLRVRMGAYGGSGAMRAKPEGALPGAYFDPDDYARSVPKVFAHVRDKLGWEVELTHDVHERLAPIEAVRLAKNLEPFRLFYLEDALPPEQGEWFRLIRQHAATPLAMGELFTHPTEWMPLVKDRLIDFIRCHVSAIGGITPARKLAAQCEAFGIRTAWHGPGDVSPIGHAANVHLGLAVPNFGIQEWSDFRPEELEVFPGCPQLKGGYVYANDKPGLGIDIDEAQAAKYPCDSKIPEWTLARLPDGTSVFP